MAIARMKVAESTPGASPVVIDKTLLGFPNLLSYLVDDKYDDGSSRERAAVSLFIEGEVVKLALNDKDQKRSLYVAASTLLDAFKALERLLAGGGGEWRVWNARTKKK